MSQLPAPPPGFELDYSPPVPRVAITPPPPPPGFELDTSVSPAPPAPTGAAPWAVAARDHIDRLNETLPEPLDPLARQSIVEQYQREYGIETPTEFERMAEMRQQREAEQGFLANLGTSFVKGTGRLAQNVTGLVAPQTGRELTESAERLYGESSGVGGFMGELGANVLQSVAFGAAAPALFAASGAGGERVEIAQRRAAGEEISGLQEGVSATLVGSIEGLMERYLGIPALKGGTEAAQKALPGIIRGVREQNVEVVKQALKEAVPGLGKASLQGGIEEGLTTLAQNIVQVGVTGKDAPITEGVGQSFLMGAAAPGVAGPLQAYQQASVRPRGPEAGGTQPAPQPQTPPSPFLERLRGKAADVISPEQKERREQAERAADRDPLTGAWNRRALDKALPSAETDPETAVVSFDANNFGQVNKIQGEVAGDEMLKNLVTSVQEAAQEISPNARVFRRGGDEIVVLAPKAVAEQIRERAEQKFGVRTVTGEVAGQPKSVDISLTGVVGETFEQANQQLQARKAERKAIPVPPPTTPPLIPVQTEVRRREGEEQLPPPPTRLFEGMTAQESAIVETGPKEQFQGLITEAQTTLTNLQQRGPKPGQADRFRAEVQRLAQRASQLQGRYRERFQEDFEGATQQPGTLEEQDRGIDPSKLRTEFVARGEGHRKLSRDLNRMVEEGTVSDVGRDLILAAMIDTDTKFLSSISTVSESRLKRGGMAYPARRLLKLRTQLAKRRMAGPSSSWLNDPSVHEAVVYLHEYGHIAQHQLLTWAENRLVREVYASRSRTQWAKFFEQGLVEQVMGESARRIGGYFAKNPDEFLVQSFAEYVLTRRASDARLKPILERMVERFRKALARLRNRPTLDRLIPIYEKMLAGKLTGLPQKQLLRSQPRIETVRSQTDPAKVSRLQGDPRVRRNAEQYVEQAGLPAPPPATYAEVDEARAKRIADAYTALKHDPADPAVKASYAAFKKETLDQWAFLQKQGVTFEPWTQEGQPYADSAAMRKDVRENQHLYFFQGGDLPADHPLAERVPNSDLTYNDVFRAVHDYFGHAKEGYGFGPRGEENAWRVHSQMYSPVARSAMTTETRGQNSWVNYGPFGEQNRKNPEKTRYAEQKAGLLPAEFVRLDSEIDGPEHAAEVARESTRPGPSAKPATKLPLDPTLPAPPSRRPSDRLNPWRRFLDQKAEQVARIPDETPMGKLRDFLGEGNIFDFKRPESWSEGKTRAVGRERLKSMDVEQIVRKYRTSFEQAGLNHNDPELHFLIEQAIRGKVPMDVLPDAAKAWAQDVRNMLDAVSAEHAKVAEQVGLTKRAETVRENIGVYLKNVPRATVETVGRARRAVARWVGLRMSEGFGKFKRDKWVLVDGRKLVGKFETEAEAEAAYTNLVNQKKQAMISQGAKGRVSPEDLNKRAAKNVQLLEPISDEWREEHEIHDPRYLIAKSVIETKHDTEMMRLFHQAAQEFGQTPPPGDEGGKMSAEEEAKWAEENGLEKLPARGKYHALDGLYVPHRVAADLNEIVAVPSALSRIYRKYLSSWKFGKVILNMPASLIRDGLGSVYFTLLSGNFILNPANSKHYKNAVRSLKAKDEAYRDLVEEGALHTEFFGEEVRLVEDFLRHVQTGRVDAMLRTMKSAARVAGDVYSLFDRFYKLAAYHKYRSLGMSKEEAAKEVNRFFPNYARVGKWSRILRTLPIGAPFISFTDQAIRITGRGLRDRPIRVASVVAFPFIANALGSMMAGLDDDERRLIEENKHLFEIYLPWRDDRGRVQTLDLRYMVPLANDVLPEERNGTLSVGWLFSNPIAVTLMEQMMNRSRFTGKEITTERMEPAEKLKARLNALIGSAAPLPSWATYGQRRIRNAYAGQSEERLANTLVGVIAGINVRAPYVAEKQVRELTRNLILEGEAKQAEAVLKLWNESYKPGYLQDMTMPSVASGARQSVRAQHTQARDAAAEFILQGDEAAAQKEIDKHNAEKSERAPTLHMSEVQARAQQFSVRGKTR